MNWTEGMLSREQTHDFLLGLQRHLQSKLPDRSVITSQVRRLLLGEGSKEWERTPEGAEAAFIGEYILPNVVEFVRNQVNRGLELQDPLSIIRVGFSAPKKFASSGTAFFPGHPFGKVFRKPEVVYKRWKGDGAKIRDPLIQSRPDFTLLCPYRILFECKYFQARLKNPAKVQLVKDLYETFFYRALPQRLPGGKDGQGWDYEYACYLAYDATEEGWLTQAWNALSGKTRSSFWQQANIFVTILSGQQAS